MHISGIPSARKKLSRASVHLAELREAVEQFRIEHPYEFRPESPGNEQGKPDVPITVMVVKAHPIPDDWALITGDILTNIRAALDHAVFPHIRAKKPDLERNLIQYPIEDRKEQWENKKKWFKSPVTKVIGQSQPYRMGNDYLGHPFRVLRELVNQDKHRDLVIASYAMSAFNVIPRDLYTVVSTTVHQVPMEVGVVVAEAQLRLAQNVHGWRWEQVPSEVEYGEFIEIPGSEPLNLLTAMQGIVNPISELLGELEAAGC
ncbi:hypothetical protein PP571_06175 [Mycobacteroides abscessus]|uniref:Uncharacterized protein n=1 Tax=Mycobacteroides immunogenum TaxID=83262 RepID=A0A7V8LL73_9MYCO|nr:MULTISPECIES: hypothetical protein [Mycobacteroides]ANO03697.1 hypothetical protein BAB75_10195 [Mycobacteroides immunogenum]KIU38176.1 hypothetical protein TL11_23515 [Mycobacteroides immunogenum]KPG04563.1 hypothetical protein AN909_22625 [Mycobacteroides immunogenum]KPG05298.1 hypothetical protein AN908_22955 [Mycobacteroides immunogenum]KPG06151.1 hypothetical protein AN910_22365 [Mycobacteroides immunogenum]